jgi:GNAT superfamily N-acetyltransferase
VSGVAAPAVLVRQAALAEILALRHAELRPGLALDTARFDGDDEPTTRHLAAFLPDATAPVGCASLMARPWRGEPAFQLRGMATRAALARRGIGTAVLRGAESTVHPEVGVLWCHARVSAVPFYRRLGWEIVSEVFDIPTVGPHHTMLRRLA